MGNEIVYLPNYEEQLIQELFLEQCGWDTCDSDHSYGPAIRNHFLIHYVAEGQGEFFKGDEQFSLFAGQGFFISPGETTFYRADKKNPWKYYWVGFSGTAAANLLKTRGITSSSSIIYGTENAKLITECVKDLYTEATLSKDNPLRTLGLLLTFLSYISADATKEKTAILTTQEKYLTKAIIFVQENFSQPITVEDIAREVGIERTYLYRIFKKHLNKNPQLFILDVRLERARQLLIESDMPIAEVADATGFSSPKHFHVAFNRKFNANPSKFRTML